MVVGTKVSCILPDVTVVAISGRLNLGNNLTSIETLLKRLIEEGARKLIVDLRDLAYIDSAGIGTLIATNGTMEKAGGRMRMASVQGLVADLFATVHMERIVAMDADVGAAVGALAAGSGYSVAEAP